jgi:3-phytase
MKLSKLLSALLLSTTLLCVACGERNKTVPPEENVKPPVHEEAQAVQIAESWQSPLFPNDDLDSLAVWHGSSGDHWIIATAKASHRLLVFDASTGSLLKEIGGPGSGPGEFQRPNGIAVEKNFVIVVERDNHRLQVLALPDFSPKGSMGAGDLTRPYGIAVLPNLNLFVTDNYQAPELASDANETLAGMLGRRVRHYSFSLGNKGGFESKLHASFGDTQKPGVLWKVETIAADPENNRLLIADELEKVLKVYSLDGQFAGTVMGEGVFRFEPEGAALLRCGEEGYWIACDQEDTQSYFRVFERRSLEYVGTFVGEKTANTDGVALTQTAFGSFSRGAFFAIHDDSAVSAFDLNEIFKGLGLHCFD